ncbi:peptide ABC transporter substrate-binding protein [Enterococcus sp. HY326]|uniref:peptide ABC transporter substrate-binding protein n=1 Tax=Enterococcus sp. HY326 TaxID=2971265 RepID=UPI002240C109|nr:peptide ABC transporter substrate-binding protein [Enterococcus sp. HY326]
MNKFFKVTGIIGLTALLLAGCSSDSNATNDSSQAASSSSTQMATEQAIDVSLPAQLSTLDTTQTTDKVTFTVAQQIFEGLYRLDETSTPVPGLAESVDISDDGLVYTFHLRDDIHWSDGTPITSNDFMYAWKKLVTPETAAPNAYWLDSVVNSADARQGNADVDSIGLAAPDDQTFEVTLANPQSSFLSVISIAWLAPQNEEYVEALGDDYASSSENMIYSGPFILENWSQVSNTWTLTKNPEYYDADVVQLATVEGSTIVEENTGINMFDTGELDLTRISGQFVQQFQDSEALVNQQEISNYFLDFNKTTNDALANAHLRKAIALAIDKEGLVNNVLADGSTVLNGLIPANLYTNENTGEDFRAYSGEYNVYDLDAAAEEWEQATSELGDSISLSLLANDSDNGKRIAEYIQAQLQDNLEGLTVTIDQQPSNNLNQSRRDGNYEMSLSGWIAGSNDLNSYFNLYRSGSSYNYGGYENEEYSALVEQANTTDANDIDAMFTDYQAAEEILLAEDAAQVPLYQSAANYLVNPNLQNVIYHSYGDYYNFREAYLTE